MPSVALDQPPARSSGLIRARIRDDTDTDILPPGTTLGGYRIIDLIGRGGIGHVYLAEYLRLGRRVALKKLRSQYNSRPEMVSRFFSEARAANHIAHENIVEITDFIEDEKHGSYLIMELLNGRDLDEVLANEGSVPIKRTLHILAQVASALAAAHDVGIVHRDLKPENIFLIERGGDRDFVKLVDFGVAKLTGTTGEQSGHTTASGGIVGTPAYMSPEQAVGRDVDLRTDVYAFGVILFELMTGRLPFDGKTLGELIVQHTTVTAPRASSMPDLPQPIPPELDDLADRCLRKERSERPANMRDVLAALKIAAEDSAPSLELPEILPPIPAHERHVPAKKQPPKKKGSPIALALVPLVLLPLIALGVWLAWPDEPPAPAPAPIAEPAPAPAPEAPPPEATTISVSFTSDPSGAEVLRDGAPIGATPLTLELDRADDAAAVFVLRAPGREEIRHEVRLDRDSSAHLVLPAVAPVEPAKIRPARRRDRRHSVIDPFE
jgi:serine/threonine protein kinase